MNDATQRRAQRNSRSRLAERGMTRFEVQAPDADRELIRALARQLSLEGPKAKEARTMIQRIVTGEPPQQGSILQALRRSPMVGADIVFNREREEGRSTEM